MSRTRTYNITRFDGGITDDIRNTADLSKCAHIAHFDIYTDPTRLLPMPGYTADMHDGSTSTGMKQYGIKAFFYEGTLYGIGTKSDGTDCKLFSKATPTTASWSAAASGEGTYDLHDKTFLHEVGSRMYWVTTDGGNTYLSYYSGSVTDAAATLQTFAIDGYVVSEYAFNDSVYITTGEEDVALLGASSVTDPAKDTAIRPIDIQSGDELLGILGHRFYPYRAQLLLWDSASSLIDQKIEFGKGRAAALGFPSGIWVGVIDENMTDGNSIFQEEANSTHSLAIKAALGSSATTLLRLHAATDTNGVIRPLRSTYRDAMLFYARIPQDATPTTYIQGIFAVGRATENSPLAVSLLLDTSTLGSIEGYYNFGSHHFFAHAGDGSISRLNAKTGTYDVTATYESLVFGADTPNLKMLNGFSVHTENLPASATVTGYYRTDVDSSWTSMGVSSTDDDRIHSFTAQSDGSPIGEFSEIQFKVEVLGKAPVKSFYLSLEELDTTPYDT